MRHAGNLPAGVHARPCPSAGRGAAPVAGSTVAADPLLPGITDRAYIDIDSLLRPVYGKAKQGASFGHTKISGKSILRRGLSPLAVTISTDQAAPVLAGVRLRAGRAGSSKGAASMVTEAINTAIEAGAQPQNILVRGDSAYCGGKIIAVVVKAGATFSFAIARNLLSDAGDPHGCGVVDPHGSGVEEPHRVCSVGLVG